MTDTGDPNSRIVWASILVTLAFFATLEGLAMKATGGVFEYPLDDVYIHLAMAEGLWSGTYGVNPGEHAAAASSALYPVLLPPIISPDFQRLLPLFWNVVGLVLSAWLWAELLLAAGFGKGTLRPMGLFLAALGPTALLVPATAFLGMEHSLHAAASLAIVLGLLRHLQGHRSWPLLFAGLFFAPLLRYEGLGLALLASGALWATGARRAAVLGALVAVVPLALFTGYLVSLDLGALPSSIISKQAHGLDPGAGAASKLLSKFAQNLNSAGGALILIFSLGAGIVWGANATVRKGRLGWFALVIAGAGISHLMFARIGWMNRYEHYVLFVSAGGFLVLLAQAPGRRSSWIVTPVALLTALIPAAVYLPDTLRNFPFAARTILLQQDQMSRFAKEFLRAPVAVNDLGKVSWNNENYVLDLWGLASVEALHLRLAPAPTGWADALVKQHAVPVAMIYDDWLQDAVGENWVRLGTLSLKSYYLVLGGAEVAFYSTAPQYVEQAKSALAKWVPTLDSRSFFTYAKGTP